MKDSILTEICIAMVLIPWTILPIRAFDWALLSPIAEIMISGYALFMVFGGIFTAVVYEKMKVQNWMMKACCVINGIYAVFGMVILIMMISKIID